MGRTKAHQPKRSFRSQPAAPIDPEEFERVMKLGEEATYKPLPRGMGLDLIGDDGESETIEFTDTPYNRGIFAIRNYCGDDTDKFMTLHTRLDAYHYILHTDEAEDWLLYDENNDDPDARPIGVHPAVLEVASQMPIRVARRFNVPDFFRRVRELAASKYPELEPQDEPEDA
jgi:hypothetical protein